MNRTGDHARAISLQLRCLRGLDRLPPAPPRLHIGVGQERFSVQEYVMLTRVFPLLLFIEALYR